MEEFSVDQTMSLAVSWSSQTKFGGFLCLYDYG